MRTLRSTIFSLLAVAICAPSASVNAAAVKPKSSAERMSYIVNAEVWKRPSWIDENFNFSTDFELATGQGSRKKHSFKADETVICDYVAKENANGMTPKFFCKFTDSEGKVEQIKVKYGEDNGEIPSEILTTRLMWAIGFKADIMYPVNEVICRGCPSADPFRVKEGATGTYRFKNAAIERKVSGSTIERKDDEGFVLDLLLAGYEPDDLARISDPQQLEASLQKKTHRDALRLLSVFLQHTDNKADQQRVLCESGKVDDRGLCIGDTYLMIQDGGAMFGLGVDQRLGFINERSKAYSDGWARFPFWENASQCKAFMYVNWRGSHSLDSPVVSDQGRVFLGKLLKAFSQGAEGQARVRELFRFARADVRMALLRDRTKPLSEDRLNAELDKWVRIFNQKVADINQPIASNPDFKCPTDIQNLWTPQRNDTFPQSGD